LVYRAGMIKYEKLKFKGKFMPILKPRVKHKKAQHRINIDESLLDKIKLYCEFVGSLKIDDFFEDAALYILNKDKEFKDWLESKNSVK
jgi:hypothetical protein